MSKRVTIRDVARQAGVSTATVSYVLNNKASENITPETIARVNAAIEKLGYVPNLSARALRYRKSNLIGVVIPQTEPGEEFMFSNPFYGDFLSAVEYTARTRGYRLLISGTSAGQSYVEIAQNHGLDAIIILGIYPTDDIDAYKEAKIPLVLVDCYRNNHSFHTVGTNDRHGGYLATRYLIQHGHRRIAFVSGAVGETGVNQKRLLGYRDALDEAGIPYDQDIIFSGNVGYEHGVKAAWDIARNHTDVTAVFVTADIMAAGVIKGLVDAGLSVPGDVSVVGFDDIFIANISSPSLTTIRQNIKEKGKAAVELALDTIENPSIPKRDVIIPLEIVERDSVRDIK
ncbi:MAG TPA: LacI family transcriptional regulator [Firmicutes bacterium]|nr:LacI family transcriptional regulator [Bacillota bacterium]